MLYIVPTPIGNLKDITLRALDVLKEADYVLAEDTRVTQKLLKHFEINTPTIAHHAHNEHRMVDKLTAEMQLGKIYALVSDAGTPAISDPGFLLIRACYEAQIKVISLPGPTALIAAIAGSGLPADRFHFEGFLPHKKGRGKRLEFIKSYPHTIVLYESPYRLIKLLHELDALFEDRRKLCIVKEISKIYESFVTDTTKNHLLRLKDESKIKGEYVLVIEGETKKKR